MKGRIIGTWAHLIAAWTGIALATGLWMFLDPPGLNMLWLGIGMAAGAGFMWADFRYSRSQS